MLYRAYWLFIFAPANANLVFPLILAILIIGSFPLDRADTDNLRTLIYGKMMWVERYLQYEDVPSANASAGFAVYPTNQETDLRGKLDYLKERGLNLYLRARD